MINPLQPQSGQSPCRGAGQQDDGPGGAADPLGEFLPAGPAGQPEGEPRQGSRRQQGEQEPLGGLQPIGAVQQQKGDPGHHRR
ncbi:MAG: hypothetical protein NTW83_00290, partial [Cyanobacteria bacterium]|nr:hypothetical protein [Cyanobacteriota bacterium]